MGGEGDRECWSSVERGGSPGHPFQFLLTTHVHEHTWSHFRIFQDTYHQENTDFSQALPGAFWNPLRHLSLVTASPLCGSLLIVTRALATWQDGLETVMRNCPWTVSLEGDRLPKLLALLKGFHNQQQLRGEAVKGMRGSVGPSQGFP